MLNVKKKILGIISQGALQQHFHSVPAHPKNCTNKYCDVLHLYNSKDQKNVSTTEDILLWAFSHTNFHIEKKR